MGFWGGVLGKTGGGWGLEKTAVGGGGGGREIEREGGQSIGDGDRESCLRREKRGGREGPSRSLGYKRTHGKEEAVE